LGQGALLKLKTSEGVVTNAYILSQTEQRFDPYSSQARIVFKFYFQSLSSLEAKSKAQAYLSGDPNFQSGESQFSKSTNVRRKIKKLASGENLNDAPDELDCIGFTEDPDLGLLFEETGEENKIILSSFHTLINVSVTK